MLGAHTFFGNPYGDHILSVVLEQATDLTQNLAVKFKHIVLDVGFRGADADKPVSTTGYRKPCGNPGTPGQQA